MKRYLRLIFFFAALLCGGTTMGQQIPQLFNFQAVVRDGGGRLLSNQQVGVRISILQGSETGPVVFSETHTPTTNANGLFTIFVGSGTAVMGTIQAVDWGQGPYYLKSEVDPLGGNAYSLVTAQRLLSVPYALFAGGGDYNNLNNKPDIDSVVSNAVVEYYTAHHVVDTLYDSVYVFNIGYDTIYNRTYDTVFTHSYDTIFTHTFDTVFNLTFDTVFTHSYDTVHSYTFDTVSHQIYDTVFTHSYDTVHSYTFDTVFHQMYDTVFTHSYDTVHSYTFDTVFHQMYDTVFTHSYDTVHTYTFDTVFNLTFDTVFSHSYDTIQTHIYDTVHSYTFDTVFHQMYDTVFTHSYDTVHTHTFDTVFHQMYDTVFTHSYDTLHTHTYDTVFNLTYDTVFTHSYDTLHTHTYDTVFNLTYDTVFTHSYDTLHTYTYDTVFNLTYDTVFTHSYDTLHTYTYDTVFNLTYDTVFSHSYDTIQTHSYDTLHTHTYDTVFNRTYDTVFTHIAGVVDTNYVDSLLSHSGFLTDYTESQILSISNDTIYLTGGSFVKLPVGFSGDYNDLSNKPTIPTNVSELTNDAGYLTTETPQVISISHDTIFLSNGGLAILPPSFSGDYNDLTNKPLIPTNVSDLTNDAGYITGYTESQSLADVVAVDNSAGHSQIKDVNDPSDSNDAVNLRFLIAQLALLQNQLDSLSQMIPQPAGLPTITTASVSAITDTSAACGGSVTSSDGATIFAKGVCWSTSPTPTISDSYTSDGIGDGSFTSSITGLTAGTTYYVRAYAINTAGTAYGQQVTFTTRLNDESITVNGYTFKMKYINGGTFNMGAQSSNSSGANYDPSATSAEYPVHSVTLRSFYMGETEVTQGLWDAVMGTGSSSHGTWSSTNGLGANYPAYNISYSEVLAFVTQLNTLTGRNFRMPTEAEWEYAARGGSQSQGYIYSGGNTIDDVAWYNGNSIAIHTVKEKNPNELGIYDMSGNVWEWCRDWRGDYSSAAQTNPTGPASGSLRVVRGGNVTNPVSNCRVSYRTNAAPTSRFQYGGFRLVMDTFSTNLDVTVNGCTFRMKYVEGGTFNMGAQSTSSSASNYDSEASSDEKLVHSVTLSSFYMGETEVTQGLWDAVMGQGSSSHGDWLSTNGLGANYPAYNISYSDVQTFVTQLNTLTGRNFRVPTEAEWEYAARGGSQSQGYKYSGGSTIGNVAWYSDNSSSVTHTVKGKTPNELGIYDMSGNVWEWCSDWRGGDYSAGAQTNPTGPETGTQRRVRGGCAVTPAVKCRASARFYSNPSNRTSSMGFRLVMDTVGQVRPPSAVLPTVTTSSVSDLTSHNASCGGNVTFSGGAEVTAKGVCWSLAPNPTISDNHTTSGNGEGSFTSTLIHLAGGTTYYVRAYATNSVGTAYGAQVSFTTPSPATNLDITVNGYTFRMKFVAGGTFNMGAQSSNPNGANYDADAYNDENPVHSVALSGFYIGETEVTQGLWDAVMGSSSSSHDEWSATYGLGSSYPAYNISYYDLQTFIEQLNSLTGRNFRMPTEAEWEYAARGGNQSQGYKYSGSNTVGDVAWISSNSNGKTHPIKGKSPNELGIYDMSGNVWEFCSDWMGWYSSDFQVNPTGLDSGSNRVRRGGAWNSSYVNENRVSRRDGVVTYVRRNYIGARLVLTE